VSEARERLNELGQRIGPEVAGWKAPSRPVHAVLTGRHCRLEPLSVARHAPDLFAANALDREGRMWTYLSTGPFTTLEEFSDWLAARETSTDPLFFAIVEGATGRATGIASYLRIDPGSGVIEVGHLAFSPLLQRTPPATEAMYLMMKHVFELGYRRYEWKCDALNAASRRAAERLGFTFEGVFRQATIYKGRNRDTAWYSIIDSEWPGCETRFLAWLDPANFDPEGRQRRRLRGT
jgi:RimJ/RimL family protein N-acetyltransferase